MGLEAIVVGRHNKRSYEGKLYLDSKSLTFRCKDLKWSVDLGPGVSVKVDDGDLLVRNGRDRMIFEIGTKVERWADKILNPPNRMKKLGIKPDQKCWLSRGFARSFRDELKNHGGKVTRQLATCDLAIWRVGDRDALEELNGIVEGMAVGINIWIVWPRGSQEIGQNDVMRKARSLGMGPSKTAAFDEGHSSMRFAKK